MRKWTRRTIIALAATAALCADSLLTLRLARTPAVRAVSAPAVPEAGETDPLARFRLEREQLRAREQAQLNDIIYNPDSDASVVAAAQRQLLAILDSAEKELTIEGILQSRGFDGALATISEQAANVLVRAEALTQRQTAVILELVTRETGLSGGNVKIIPVK